MSIDSISNSSLISSFSNRINSRNSTDEVNDFSEFLKNNFSKIDSNQDNSLSVSEINDATKDTELDNVSDFILKLDLNQDKQISLSELESNDSLQSNISQTVKGIIDGVAKSDTANSILSNAVGRIANAYKLNEASSSILSNLIEKII